MYFIVRRRETPFPLLFWLFGAFIITCGFTHLLEVVTTYTPLYRLSGTVKLLTALVSWATVVALVPITPLALTMRSPHDLEREIADRARAEQRLLETNRQLVEAERLKGEFLANVSHELRTPLTLVLGPIESILAGESGTVRDAQRPALQTIHNNAVRLMQMVNGLLDFSRLDAGGVEIRREPVEVATLARAVFDDFAPLLARKRLGGVFDAPGQLLVETDRYALERILFNLLSNAVKFTPDGGTVAVSVRWAGDRLRLAVADTGIGIAPDDIPRLFERFRQLEGSSTRRFEGSGLGLALVKEFAELLDGFVTVESAPGRGSTFTVDVAAAAAEQTSLPADSDRRPCAYPVPRFDPEPTPVPTADNGPAGRRVLVAEDNVEMAGYISSVLAAECRTEVVRDGEEALESVRRQPPDLVLADVMMPRRDGLSLCRELKADPATAAIPVVLLTALTHREALLAGWEAGADEYLFKPFHPRELATRVRTVLATATARRRAEEQARQLAFEHASRLAAEEAVRARDRFLSIASHELRTPLNPLQIHVQLLLKCAREGRLDGPLAGRTVEILEACDRQVKQFGRLVGDLLDVSRIVSGRLTLHPEPVDLGAAAVEVAARFQPELERAGCSLQIVRNGTAVGHWDRTRIEQVLANLLSNAAKYGKGKPVEVEVDAGATSARLRVRDHGIGVGPADRGRIFERFERAAHGYEYGGLGLGLFIIREIVTAHGGSVSVADVPGGGAEFTVELPYGQVAPVAVPAEPAANSAAAPDPRAG